MTYRLKLIFTGILISLFAVQTALACACDYENISEKHDHMNHHDMMMGHDMMLDSEECEEPCVASVLEVDDSKLNLIAEYAKLIDQENTLISEAPFFVSINVPVQKKRYLIPLGASPPNWSLHKQGVLLLI